MSCWNAGDSVLDGSGVVGVVRAGRSGFVNVDADSPCGKVGGDMRWSILI